jgi:hypothetical protein
MADDMVDSKPQQAWKIHVHVKEKVISVSCGSAEQRIKWLGHVGIARWDSENNQGWTKLDEQLSHLPTAAAAPTLLTLIVGDRRADPNRKAPGRKRAGHGSDYQGRVARQRPRRCHSVSLRYDPSGPAAGTRALAHVCLLLVTGDGEEKQN